MTAIDSSLADPKEKLFVIGDLLIDRTYYVDVEKLSPEAPVPVAMLTGDPIDTPGGAGLAAAFAAVNKIPVIFGTYTSLVIARKISINYKLPFIYPGHTYHEDLNSIKIRYIDNERHYHLLRVDSDRITPPPFKEGEEEEWFGRVKKTLTDGTVKVLTLLDYRKGLLDEARSQRLINIAHKVNVPVYVDSRCHNLSKFTGADILKLNKEEFQNACRSLGIKDSNSQVAAHKIIEKLKLKHLIITQGAEGATIFTYSHKTPSHVATPEHEGSPDVTGCGDVFDVTFCYYWGIKKIDIDKALRAAVERATRFAYEPIGERLKWQNLHQQKD